MIRPMPDEKGLVARTTVEEDRYVLLSGSATRKDRGARNHPAALRRALEESGKVKPMEQEPDALTTGEDMSFTSPSAAAAVVSNRTATGRTEWRHERENITCAEWEARRLPLRALEQTT